MGSITQKQISSFFSLLLTFFLAYEIIYSLSILETTVTPEIYLNRVALALDGFLFAIFGGWLAFRFIGGLVFALFAAVMVVFVETVSASSIYIWTLFAYAALCAALFGVDQHFENQVAVLSVDREKNQNEKNDLGVSYKAKGEAISILFEKYSTYYNLRKLAEELATTLSVSALCQMVVDRSFNFIPRGDMAMITLAQSDGPQLPVVAYREAGKVKDGKSHPPRVEEGDLFDLWVIKNRRRLIVTDTHQDFRFDVKEASQKIGLRSLIIAPVLNEGRVMGTLRLNAAAPELFTNDDLRLLDTIAVLASSAISNAMLYEKTEELAIKDSLTGLYVRRYFFDRLKDEHRRALMSNRPLSLLMCDLDHFKECNDRLGHAVGDLMLVEFAQIMLQTVENAIVARYGGEEFVVLLPERGKEAAFQVANKIRENVEKKPFMVRRERITMTVSIGVATLPDDTRDLEMLLQKSDQALYRAKRDGRNRVC